MKTPAVSLALLSCLTIVHCGCSVFGSKPKSASEKSWSISKLWKKEYQKPNSVSVIWSPDVLTLTGKPPTRGFGGRVFFYNDKTQAVPVDGELIVHGYRGDPMLGESEQVQADKTYRFTAEQLTGHFSPSELGASYSVWIPWDAADGFREEITLIPTFKGLDGLIVQGAPAKLFLPGRSLDSSTVSAKNPGASAGFESQTVSYLQNSISTNTAGSLPTIQRQTEPTTIELPALGSLGRTRSVAAPSPGFILSAPTNPSGSQIPNAGYGPAYGPAAGGSLVPNSSVPTSPTSYSLPTTANQLQSPGTIPQANMLPSQLPGAMVMPAAFNSLPSGGTAPTVTDMSTGAMPTPNVPTAISPATTAPFGTLRTDMAPLVPSYGEQASKPWQRQQP